MPPVPQSPDLGATVGAAQFLGGTNFESGRQRAMWISAFTAMVLWMFLLLLNYIFDKTQGHGRRRRKGETYTSARPVAGAPVTEVTSAEVYETGKGGAHADYGQWNDRWHRAARAARTNFILIFSACTITALGYGPSGSTIALVWIAFGIGALWGVLELLVDNHWVRVLLSLGHFTLIIIIYSLAFRSRLDDVAGTGNPNGARAP